MRSLCRSEDSAQQKRVAAQLCHSWSWPPPRDMGGVSIAMGVFQEPQELDDLIQGKPHEIGWFRGTPHDSGNPRISNQSMNMDALKLSVDNSADNFTIRIQNPVPQMAYWCPLPGATLLAPETGIIPCVAPQAEPSPGACLKKLK